MQIEILLNHQDFIIVYKPVGIAVQNEQQQSSLLTILCQQLGVTKLWLVHRLDKVTSGILILAKNSDAAASFGQLFSERKIEKFYLAVGSKKPKKKQGTIKGGMAKVRDGKWILNNGQENHAITQFFSYGILPNIRLFIIKPLTGKTHQIRVALKSVGSPILGDQHYKGESADRTYLHAYAVKFVFKGEQISITCPPSDGLHFLTAEMRECITGLDTPWALTWPKSKT